MKPYFLRHMQVILDNMQIPISNWYVRRILLRGSLLKYIETVVYFYRVMEDSL